MMIIHMLWGKPLYVWAGILLVAFVALQIISGALLMKGQKGALKVHKWLTALIILVALIHGWYAIRLWFY